MIKSQENIAWRACFCVWASVCLILLPAEVWAGVNVPIGGVLCTGAGWFSGNLGTGLETISIIVFGLLGLVGHVSWQMALLDIVAVAALHSAGLIVETLNAGAPAGC